MTAAPPNDRKPPGIHPPIRPTPARWPWLVGGGVLALVLLTPLLSSLSAKDEDKDAALVGATSKYDQTWPAPYSETTCVDWLDSMTPEQQFAAAADILAAARNKIDGGSGLPPDTLIDEFAGGVSNVCVEPSMTLMDATFGLYNTEPRFHP